MSDDAGDTGRMLAAATKRLRRMSVMALQQMEGVEPLAADGSGDESDVPQSTLGSVAEQAATFVALFDFDGDGEGELTLRRGDRLLVIGDSGHAGWWIGSLVDAPAVSGIFPADFVCEVPATAGAANPHEAIAEYDFDPTNDGELPLRAGDSVMVVCDMGEGWVYAQCNGELGIVPASYVRAADDGGVADDGATGTDADARLSVDTGAVCADDGPPVPLSPPASPSAVVLDSGKGSLSPANGVMPAGAGGAGAGSGVNGHSRSHSGDSNSTDSGLDRHDSSSDDGTGEEPDAAPAVSDAPEALESSTPAQQKPPALVPVGSAGAASAVWSGPGLTPLSKGLESPLASPASGSDTASLDAEAKAALKAEKQRKLRSRVILEILTTEITYVKNLHTFSELYIIPLERRDAPWKTSFLDLREVAVLLSNFDQMLHLNTQFLTDLRRQIEGSDAAHGAGQTMASLGSSSNLAAMLDTATLPKTLPDPELSLGAIFCRYAPRFSIYEHYAKNQQRASEALDNLEQVPEAKAFFDNLRVNPRCNGNTIRSYLIMPVQRIPRYRLLAAELLKRTPAEHDDTALLKDAGERINEVAMKLNAAAREQENADQLRAIEEQFRGVQLDLLLSGRHLVKEGRLTKLCRRADKTFYFHLFNDLLLYSEKSLLGYKLHRRLELKTCAVEDVDEESAEYADTPANAFKIRSDHKSFIVCADTQQLKEEWLTSLNKCVVETRAGSGVDEDAVLANLAPVWVPDRARQTCQICNVKFTLTRRRHHCRMCGFICCNSCSRARRGLRNIDLRKPVRVCDKCLKGQSQGVSSMFHVRVHVLAGNQLPTVGTSGTCDPYVKVFCGPQLYGQTPVKKKDVHPRWSGCSYKCRIKHLRTAEVRLEVWDHDLVGDHSFLGQATFPLGDLLTLQAHATAREEPLLVALRGMPQSTLKIEVKLEPPILSIEAADDPALVIKRWEEMLVGDALDKPVVLAVQALYREAITHCKLTPSKHHMIGVLEDRFAAFNAQPLVVSVKTRQSRLSSNARDVGPRVAAFTKLVESERVYVEQMDAFLLHVAGPLSDVTDGASLTARRQSVHQAAIGGGPKRRFSMMSGMSINAKKRRDREMEALLRSGEVAVLWSSLRQVVTLNKNFLRELEEAVTTLEDSADDVSAWFGPVLAEFAPLLTMYTSYQKAQQAAAPALRDDSLDSLLDDMAATPATADLCSLRDRRNGTLSMHSMYRRRVSAGGAGEEEKEASPGRSLLETLWEEPLHRVGVYKKAVEDLVGATPVDHADSAPLLAAHRTIVETWHSIQRASTSRGKGERLQRVERAIVDWPSAKLGPIRSLDSPSTRYLVREGQLLLVSSDHKEKQLHAWLLGDWLVCGSEVRRGAYRFRNKYQLAGAVLHAREFTRGKVAELSVDVHDDGGGTAHDNGATASAPATAADVGSMPVSASVAAMAGAAGTLVSRSSGLRGAKNDDSTARVFGGDAGKTHNFAEGSFEDAKWCGMCHEFMWGIRKQGVRCGECGLAVHRHCAQPAAALPCVKTSNVARRRKEAIETATRNCELAFSITVGGQWLAFVPGSMAEHVGWVTDLQACIGSSGAGDRSANQDEADSDSGVPVVGDDSGAGAGAGAAPAGVLHLNGTVDTRARGLSLGIPVDATIAEGDESSDGDGDSGSSPGLDAAGADGKADSRSAMRHQGAAEVCMTPRTGSSRSLIVDAESRAQAGAGSAGAGNGSASPPAPRPTCPVCHVLCSDTNPQHQCRNCTRIVCSNCSAGKVPLKGPGSASVRVCDPCAEQWLSVSLQGFSI